MGVRLGGQVQHRIGRVQVRSAAGLSTGPNFPYRTRTSAHLPAVSRNSRETPGLEAREGPFRTRPAATESSLRSQTASFPTRILMFDQVTGLRRRLGRRSATARALGGKGPQVGVGLVPARECRQNPIRQAHRHPRLLSPACPPKASSFPRAAMIGAPPPIERDGSPTKTPSGSNPLLRPSAKSRPCRSKLLVINKLPRLPVHIHAAANP